MVNHKLAILVGLLSAVAVNAQDTSGISQCVLSCVSSAASDNGCSSFTDLQCVCTNTAFQQASLQCLQSNCPDQVDAATQLQQQECASGTASRSSSTSSTSSATSASSSSSGNAAAQGMSVSRSAAVLG
ncbi:hypothetical protein K435DRAFT_707540, partial [Dendrothele bispora CBS 962.96]